MSEQKHLPLGVPVPDVPPEPVFHGEGYEKPLDRDRLSRHCQAVLDALRSVVGFVTYEELAGMAEVPAGSVRTRVSNLKAWGHEIEVRTRADRFREVRLKPKGDRA